tara:strand:- start:1272 stop:2102 length:831 start_codon:yes stop_codon:yes gene_type:complete
MAKKKKDVVEETITKETVVVEEPKIKTPKVEVKSKKPMWEIKDRAYYLKDNMQPVSRMIRSANIYWFDEEKGYERELKYCQNQTTPFVDEMKGDQRLSHIVFRTGALFVPKEKTVLQKLLSLYHPDRDRLYYEHKPVQRAGDELSWLEFQVDALSIAKQMDIDTAEAILRVEKGSNVSNLSSKELKRDIILFARQDPKLFLELTADDNVVLRNFGIRASEAGIIKLSDDQRYFIWESTGRKIMTVPFDEHPYTSLAHWFKTDEGMEIYKNIEKRLG